MDMPLQQLIDQVKAASSPLEIQGHGSKQFYGNAVSGEPISTADLSGIIEYDSSELVLTAKAGTPLAEIEQVLEESGQMLAFEPPILNGRGTLGGLVATGLAGTRRPWSGGVRDYVLGLHLVNGKGEYCRFGGQVMKNVAGYDVSRLMAGALGCLGLITQVSLKVLPKPQVRKCAVLSLSLSEFIDRVRPWMSKMTPLTGLAHDGRQGYIRLEGFDETVSSFARDKGLTLSDDTQFWCKLGAQELPVFNQPSSEERANIWRLSLPKWTVLQDISQPYLMDWAGGQYWVKGGSYEAMQTLAQKHGGYLCAYDCSGLNSPAFQELSAGEMVLHKNLKQAYDPKGIFNPGRLYPGL